MTAGKGVQQISSEAVQRCPVCGRRSAVSRCSACGAEVLPSSRQLAGQVPVSVPVPQRRETGLTAVGIPRRLVAAPHAASRPAPLQPGEQVAGRVLIVSAPVSEPVDPDHWKWLAIPAWGLVILISPVAVGIIAWMTAGPLAAAVVVFICISVLRFTFSDRLLQSWQFVAALRGRHIVESVPNVSIRLRAADEREVQLRVKGRLNAGSVVEGDRVRADGRWRFTALCSTTLSCSSGRFATGFGLGVGGAIACRRATAALLFATMSSTSCTFSRDRGSRGIGRGVSSGTSGI